MPSFLKKTRIIFSKYAQALFVLIAFALMVVSSYYFVSETERRNLRRSAENVILYTEANIKSAMLEFETLLGGVSETICSMLIKGDSDNDINNYFIFINDYVWTSGEKRLLGAVGFYGYFDVFDGKMLMGLNNRKMPTGVISSLPWYSGAVVMQGDISMTEPVLNAETNKITVTLSRRIFNREGTPFGIVCLDVEIDRIMRQSINAKFSDDGYGFFLSQSLMVIGHPKSDMIGLNYLTLRNDISHILEEYLQTGSISEVVATDYYGKKSILFAQKLYNGWNMGLVTPKDNYYKSTRNLAIILSTLGAIFALLLIWMLLRIAEEKARAEERVQIMMDTAPFCAIFWDKNLNLIDCNQEAVKLFGLADKKEFKEKFNWLSPDYQPDGTLSGEKSVSLINKALVEGYSRFDWMHQKLDGEPIPADVICIRVMHKGEFTVTEYIRDLREQKAMIAEMRKAEIAEESSKAKSDFLAKMSHEIRTPMNAIMGITEIQLQDESHPQITREAFERIYNSSGLLLGIINDILDLSKIEAGKLILIPAQYDIASLIHDTVQLVIMRFESKPIELVLDVNEYLPIILVGDELRIKQILTNLLSNAYKYTNQGMINLKVYSEPAETGDKSKITLVFIVSDTGQGMTDEQVRKLGTEYSRFNMEANRTTEGAGLGMNITRNLIQLMKGNIAIESTPGMGSSFTVRLPQELTGSSAIGRELADNLMQLNIDNTMKIKTMQMKREFMPYGRVLVVDDVETNLYVAKGLMAPYGLSIDTAMSGFEAIDKIREGSVYDIVFMDHMMPKMDGIEATKIIRDSGYKSPIVALTANALAGQAEMFLDNGFDDFISKPIDLRQLDMALNRMIRDKKPVEVVNEARKQREKLYFGGRNSKEVDPQLAEFFVRDAKKSIMILETLYVNKCRTDEEISMFIINIHAMKSALANIGEANLSAEAAKLEQAGREKNNKLILSELPLFMEMLCAAVEKLELKIEDHSSSEDAGNNNFLKEKYIEIQAACLSYDKVTAKKALEDIKQMAWPQMVKDQLGVIAGLLLHSDFDEAAKVIDDYLKQL